ncbi:MAG: hypothetical protein ABR509_02250 [Candidatus Limnocylindria bacterium]
MAVMGARPAPVVALPARPRIRAATRRRRAPGVRSPSRTVVRHVGAGRRLARNYNASTTLIVIAAAACLALFYLSQSTHVAAIGYEVDEMEAQLADVRAERQQLILEISEARSPAVIERRALEHLGLRPIDEARITFATPPVELAD